MEIVVWALWIVAGGQVNGYAMVQPKIEAYFTTSEECQRVGKMVGELTWPLAKDRKFECIQAKYWMPKSSAPK